MRPCVGTTKGYVSHVVLDAPKWEPSVAYQLERMPEVIAYARNDHLDFTIDAPGCGARTQPEGSRSPAAGLRGVVPKAGLANRPPRPWGRTGTGWSPFPRSPRSTGCTSGR